MIDPFLQKFAALVEGNKARFSITLCVGGMFVTGHLVSSREFIDNFVNAISDATTNDPNEATASEAEKATFRGEFRGTMAEHFADLRHRAAKASPRDEDLPTMIHVVNCRFFHAGLPKMNPPPGLIWRGKISSVDGFWLGEVGDAVDNRG